MLISIRVRNFDLVEVDPLYISSKWSGLSANKKLGKIWNGRNHCHIGFCCDTICSIGALPNGSAELSSFAGVDRGR